MRRKKKGSSLILVIVSTVLIFTVGTAMLTIVNIDYRARINKSEKVKNLYQADSGLNLVENVISKEAEAAIICATNSLVKSQLEGYDSGYKYFDDNANIDKDTYDRINKHFKIYFIEALTNIAGNTISDPNDITKLNSIAPNETDFQKYNNLLYSIKNLTYMYPKTDTQFASQEDYKQSLIGTKVIYDGSSDNIFQQSPSLRNGVDLTSKLADINIKSITVEKSSYESSESNYKITLEVSSTFKDDLTATRTGALPNTKTVTTKFIITAPDFQQSLKSVAKLINTGDFTFNRAITADGNLIYSGTADNSDVTQETTYDGLNIKGGVWVKGESTNESPSNTISSKYNNGIVIKSGKLSVEGTNDSKDVLHDENRNGDVYTNGSVSIVNGARVKVPSNIYAKNVYVGPEEGELIDSSKNNLLEAGTVVTNNDLVLNSSESVIGIGNYYGINDITIDGSGNSGQTIDPSIVMRQSSSIIVNNAVDENFLYLDKAFVGGVAYLNIDNQGTKTYQTGESVAIKGNYSAYQDIVPGYKNADGSGMKLSYYDSYLLFDGTAQQKADYFKYYYTRDKNVPNSAGVYINELHATGASVSRRLNETSDGEIEAGPIEVNRNGLSKEDETILNGMKMDYTKKVLLMNQTKKSAKGDELSSDQQQQVYNNYNVARSVMGKAEKIGSETLDPVVNFSSYLDYLQTDEGKKSGLEKTKISGSGIKSNSNPKYVFNSDPDVKITIKPDGVHVDGQSGVIEPTTINESGIEKQVIYAVIMTSGNVEIDSTPVTKNGKTYTGINLCGAIISGKNVNISGDNINIEYNEQKVKYTIAEQEEVYKIFEKVYGDPYSTGDAVEGTALAKTNTYNYQYFDTNNLKEGMWKLEVKNSED